MIKFMFHPLTVSTKDPILNDHLKSIRVIEKAVILSACIESLIAWNQKKKAEKYC